MKKEPNFGLKKTPKTKLELWEKKTKFCFKETPQKNLKLWKKTKLKKHPKKNWSYEI